MLFITHNRPRQPHLRYRVRAVRGQRHRIRPDRTGVARAGASYTKGLLTSMPRLSPADRRTRLIPIAGKFPDLTHLPSGCVFHPRCAHRRRPVARMRKSSHQWRWIMRSAAGSPSRSIPRGRQPHRRRNRRRRSRLGATRRAAARGQWPAQNLSAQYTAGAHKAPHPGNARQHSVVSLRAPRGARRRRRLACDRRRRHAGRLVGESGAASPLGRCVVRLLDPSAGSIVFSGRDICREGRKRCDRFADRRKSFSNDLLAQSAQDGGCGDRPLARQLLRALG